MTTHRLRVVYDVGVSGNYALEFPSNSAAVNTTDPFAVMQFLDPHLDGLPMWGASNAGITLIKVFKTKATLQPGYTAHSWMSRTDGYFVDPIDFTDKGNWGCHPYPAKGFFTPNNYMPGGKGCSIWEIATAGRDIIDDGLEWVSSSGNPSAPTITDGFAVQVNTVYIQALRITYNNADSKTFRYYFNLPSTADNDVIEWTETTSGYANTPPPAFGFTYGDSPWYSNYQHERADHILDQIKIFNADIGEANMLLEASDFARIKTSAGASSIWWGRNGFDSGHDTDGGLIVDHYGTGRELNVLNPSSDSAQRINLVSRVT